MWAAGALFGLYFLIWEGAPLLLVILDIYILVQSIVNSVQRNNDPKVYWIMAVVNFTAMFMFMLVPAQRSMMQDTFVLSLALSAVLPIVLYWIFKETAYLGTAAYLAVLAIVGVVMAIVVFTVAVFAPGSFDIVTTGFLRITALNGNGSILESQPMSFQIMWSNLGVVAIFGLMGIVLLSMYEKWKDGSVGLIVVWSIMILVVSMLQRRFVYYLAPIMGVSCAYVIVFLGSKLIRKYKAEARTLAVSCVIVFCLAFILVPNTLAAGRQAERAEFEPTSAWLSACDWLKDNTPEPFESGYYYQIYKSANIDNGYRVLSWWDSGYWIVRIAQRPVLCTPGGGLLNETAEILANDNITEATMRARELRVEYIIIDYNMIGIKWPSIQNGKGKEIENSFMNKLWTEEKVEGWVKCWQSKEKYAKDSQVKIYKYKEE